MATASLLPSLSYINNRFTNACFALNPSHQKGMRCFSLLLHKKRCNFKLYIIPYTLSGHHGLLKTSASVSSINADVSFHQSLGNETAFSGSHGVVPSNGVNDFERQLQELFDEVKAMILSGNKDDAVDLLRANYEAVREQIDAGLSGIEEAATLDIIALGYMTIGDLSTVASILNLLNTVVENLKDDGALLDLVLVHMGSMYSALGKFGKSMVMYQRVISILESKYGKDSVFFVSPLLGMAKVLGSIGSARKAIDVYQHVIVILESSRGAETEDLVVPLFRLGNLFIKEGRTTDADICFDRILSIYRKLYGETDGRVGMALCSLANVKCLIGNVEEAIDMYRKALQIIKDSDYLALDDNMIEKMRIDLAELLHVVGRGMEGQKLLEECLLITERYKGKDHPSTVTHLLNLATSYSQSKNFVEAERLLRTSLEIMAKAVRPNDPSITFPMLRLAVTLCSLNRDEEAEQLALEVLHIRQKSFGQDSLPVGEALDCLVSIQSRLGRGDAELLEMLRQVLKIQEKELGHESEEVMQTLNKIVFCLDKLGRKDEKVSFERRLAAVRSKLKQMVRH